MTFRPWTEWLAARDGPSVRGALRAIIARHGHWAAWTVPAIYAGCAAAFVTDLTSTDTLAFGVFYVPLVATAVFHRDNRAVWVLTAIACAMVIAGTFIPSISPDLLSLVGNRILSICAIFATAMVVRHARSIQDRLAEQTRRAEAAEVMKTEVLNNLSQEIRAPLTSMISILELVATGSRPDQKAALEMVRGAGRRLVMTIDNLVDLTQFEPGFIPSESVDLGLLLRQTAETKRSDAANRQISLTIDLPDGDARALANPWATRRILENMIADAVTYTSPGGRIEVRTESEGQNCSAVIFATGTWPPAAHLAASDVPDALLTPSVMGLALSRRLARAMNARLVFSNGPGDGTTVRLRLLTATRPEMEPA